MVALALQGISFLVMFLAMRQLAFPVTPLQFTFGCGILAGALSHLCRQGAWWLPIQILFAPAILVALTLDLRPEIYLAMFLLLLLIYWSSFRGQVPIYLSSQKVWSTLGAELPSDRGFQFLDAGSGLGGLLVHLAKTFPLGQYTGIESAPLPFLFSWSRVRLNAAGLCRVKWGSYWDVDFGEYDIVFTYLSPAPMPELWQKARREMKPGARFISNTFAVPDVPPDKTITVDDLHRSTLYIWEM